MLPKSFNTLSCGIARIILSYFDPWCEREKGSHRPPDTEYSLRPIFRVSWASSIAPQLWIASTDRSTDVRNRRCVGGELVFIYTMVHREGTRHPTPLLVQRLEQKTRPQVEKQTRMRTSGRLQEREGS